ncbi:ABC transporter ATP-binding protein [Castellaniella sp.]|uniref:metal ABC transporter ATP-binding protein n=1 Tax=Castellaniella sp. TaxID=1955812 RepID=UPI002AFFED5F|nr:ABC transporter ATP-binding protein [Castellaniella sp.]
MVVEHGAGAPCSVHGARSDAAAGAPAPASAIELQQVWLGWRDRIAVRDACGTFSRGTLTALVGPNGAGKSTLIKALTGRLSPVRGQIRIEPDLGRSLACLPQSAELDLDFPISTFDLVALGAWHRVGAWRGLDDAGRDAVESALSTVGLAGFGHQAVNTLSGGQLRRALFARLMLRDAQVILLDEPFAAVDRATTDDLLVLLHQWHQEGRTVIAVLHDLDMVQRHFPESLLLAGQVVDWGPSERVLSTANLHLARHLCAGGLA